jgi:hypothetical protein
MRRWVICKSCGAKIGSSRIGEHVRKEHSRLSTQRRKPAPALWCADKSGKGAKVVRRTRDGALIPSNRGADKSAEQKAGADKTAEQKAKQKDFLRKDFLRKETEDDGKRASNAVESRRLTCTSHFESNRRKH